MTGRRPRIIVLTAPSGSGKTTIANRVMEAMPELRFSVSATTRARRPHEQEGVHYHFVTCEAFGEMVDAGEMLEYEEVYPGRYYGTLRSELNRSAEDGPVLLDIDVRGALKVKEFFGDDALIIFVRPPSQDELERRLRLRATEDEATIAVRLERARHELTFSGEADVVIDNDDLFQAVSETLTVIRRFLVA
jgi:guanylate kinase